jgi:hypothetical protein
VPLPDRRRRPHLHRRRCRRPQLDLRHLASTWRGAWAETPDQRIIGGGHSQDFVDKEFSGKIIRTLVGSHRVSRRCSLAWSSISNSRAAKNQWNIAGRKGQYVARGVGGSIHGFRATFVCVDDPYSSVEDG